MKYQQIHDNKDRMKKSNKNDNDDETAENSVMSFCFYYFRIELRFRISFLF